ncbi:tail fiber assembly protein [Desulfocurvibacter africanus]|uniref:Prophage PSPPH06, putative tail fiber protein n=1 Tax=Desulfocurvibacter africanus subsp. africanus str. Walvis Bay TaxID=690850 RepID=F3YY47_DESAF|nr:tail fiber assembly protein [Desulfocurvibacter africanus]EGJ51823.1 prophage PSPPH06, putative tail fiber protein [Desulfocurvibacter africanus subsp. africanus str. Walvis Bay]
MTMYFLPSTGGFRESTIHTIPSDAVEITSEEHRALLDAQSQGCSIQPGPDGRPVAVEPPAPSSEQLAASIRAERDRRLAAVVWLRDRHRDELELGLATTLDIVRYSALMTYIQALRDLPEQAGFPWTGPEDAACPWPGEPA